MVETAYDKQLTNSIAATDASVLYVLTNSATCNDRRSAELLQILTGHEAKDSTGIASNESDRATATLTNPRPCAAIVVLERRDHRDMHRPLIAAPTAQADLPPARHLHRHAVVDGLGAPVHVFACDQEDHTASDGDGVVGEPLVVAAEQRDVAGRPGSCGAGPANGVLGMTQPGKRAMCCAGPRSVWPALRCLDPAS